MDPSTVDDTTATAASEALADRLEDMAMSAPRHQGGQSGHGKRGGGKGGKGGGGGGREGGRDRREVDLSKALSRLLRHQAGNAGVELDREGFASLDRVVSSLFSSLRLLLLFELGVGCLG